MKKINFILSKILSSLIIVTIFISVISFANAQTATKVKAKTSTANIKKMISDIKVQESVVDLLSKRILIKNLSKEKLIYSQWNDVRIYLLNNPQLGYDFIYKWDKIRPTDKAINGKEQEVNSQIERADNLVERYKFNKAFKIYQEVALSLKKEIQKGKRENQFLYGVMLQSMGRALFGAGRYEEAIEVYQWIPQDYPRLRQVMFEKMWAGFRAGRLDISLGAIGSQESSYFSSVIEPETYLLKVYIFKKLCRDDDIKELRKEIDTVKIKLNNPNADFYNEWVMSDIEYLSLQNLTKIEPNSDKRGSVSAIDRRKEIDSIQGILKKKYENDKERIRKGIDQTLAYSYVALGTKDFTFIKQKEFDRAALMEKGDEIWPAMDAEDWLDEMNGHIYIGESLCKTEAQ